MVIDFFNYTSLIYPLRLIINYNLKVLSLKSLKYFNWNSLMAWLEQKLVRLEIRVN